MNWRTGLVVLRVMAAVESLTALVGRDLPSLFGPESDGVQRAIGRFASGDRFSLVGRNGPVISPQL